VVKITQNNVYINFGEGMYKSVHINCGGYSQKNLYINCGTDLYYIMDIKYGGMYS